MNFVVQLAIHYTNIVALLWCVFCHVSEKTIILNSNSLAKFNFDAAFRPSVLGGHISVVKDKISRPAVFTC